MNTCKTIVAALLIGASPAAWAQYNLGTNDLANTNISAALTDFTTAVAGSPTDPNANVYLALTRLLALPNDSATSGFLDELGFSANGRNVYQWKSKPQTNSNGHTVIPLSVNGDDFTGELRNDIVPAMVASETNLAQVTDTSFTLFMPGSVTHFADVTMDYGDVQMSRAILDAFTLLGYTMNTWNADAHYSAVSNIMFGEKSIDALLTNFPAVLTLVNTGDLPLATGAFTNAVNEYFAASQFIRSRSPGARRLFNLDPDEATAESNFRATLSNLEASLNGPVTLALATNYTVCMSNFFNGDSPRALLPVFAGQSADFIWDSFPDTTLGGVISGLTQTNLGKALLKFGTQAQLDLPDVAYTVLCSATNLPGGSLNGVVLGADGNLYGTTADGGAAGFGAFFTATRSGGFAVLYSFGRVTDAYGNPVDGGSPSGLVLGSDSNFYGTTSYGGANGNNTGTIFRMTAAGSLTTVYSFGDQDDGSISGGNPLLPGQDGNLYGTTQYGDTNGEGGIFQFIPPAPGGGTEGTFTDLYAFPYSPNPMPAEAGALLQDANGYFFGVTQFGGDNGGGSIFQFIPGNNGASPQFNYYSFPLYYDSYSNQIWLGLNTPTGASNGLLYGTAQYGGNNIQGSSSGEGDGFLYCIDTNGNFTNLFSFDETHFDGYGPIGAMLLRADGSLDGVTSSGGANNRGTVFRFTPGAGISFPVWFDEGLGEQQNGQNNYNGGSFTISTGLARGADRYFGTTPDGGQNHEGTVFSISSNAAPLIAISPANATNAAGATVTLNVTATGAAPLYYQWQQVGGALPADATGAATDSLTFPALTSQDAGDYFVVVTNTYGSATSAVAVVSVVAPPVIVSQPASPVTVFQGQALSLQVGATGGSLAFQWFANNVALSDAGDVFGSGTSNLVITPVFAANSGSYSVIVANPYAWVTSAVSVVTVQIPTLAQQYSAGITALTASNINTALADFTGAVTAAPANADANVYLALTRLLALPNQPAGSKFLTRLGFSAAGRDVYDWTSQPPESTHNGSHHLVVPLNLDADEFTAEMRTNVMPALIACESNLAQITDTNFGMFLPESVTHFPSVTIDYGDVQMMRAVLDAATVFGYTLHSWNLDAQFGAVSNIIATDKSLQAVLSANPNLLKIANPGDQAQAGAAFTNAINRYFAASQFIRSRRAGVRLFNLVTNDLQDEQNFRLFLSDLEGSMSTPFGGPGVNASAIPGAAFYDVISSFTNVTISMANFFNGKFNPRALFPAITNTSFIWDSFPDTTLGGLFNGLTETNLGKIFLKDFNAQLNLPGAVYTVLSSATGQLGTSMNGVVMGPSGGNLYGTTTFGGAAGSGTFFRATPSGGFTVLHSFGLAYDQDGNSLDGVNPGSVVLGSDKNFYGSTSYGGTNGFGNGTIFRITPGGSLTTVYTFGDQDDGTISGGNPLLLGKDGHLYGVTAYGGDNYAGVLFQFIPPSAGGTEGSFTTLYSLPSSGAGALVQGTDGNFYGVAQYGGYDGVGGVFQYIPGNGGQFNPLYSFPLLYDAYDNQITLGLNTLVQAADGVFYGTAQYGGNNIQNSSSGEGDGFIYSVDTNGNFATLYSFDESNFDGFGPIGALVEGANGAFYGIASSGGGNGDGTIFKFTPGSAPVSRVWFDKSLGVQQSGQYNNYYSGLPPVSMGLVAAPGGLFGTTPGGGANGNGTVFSFNDYNAASILIQPVSGTNLAGTSAALTVTAGGSPVPTYKWQKVGGALPANATGANSSTLSFTRLTAADAGSYFVVASNSHGSSTSAVVVLTVLQGPAFTSTPKPPSGILQGDKLSLTVAASGSGLTYEWLRNSVILTNNGFNISGAGAGTLVINPAYITNSGAYQVIASNSIGATTSAVFNVTVSADTVKPAVTIASPAKDGTRSNVVAWTFSGSATDNVRVTNVSYWIINQDGSPAVGPFPAVVSPASGSSVTWTATVPPPAGSNIFYAQSLDFSGNPSPVVSRKFFALSPVPLTVNVAGTGSGSNFITGETGVPANGALLNVGESYSITAKPDARSFFVDWTGTAGTVTTPTLNFNMRSNTSLTANFVTNMFLAMAGNYNGLFTNTNGTITEETAGMIGSLTLKTNGFFSGTLYLDGSAPGISGTFSPEGYWSNGVRTVLDKNVEVELFVTNSSPRTITGWVIGTNLGGWTSEVMLVATLPNSSNFARKFDMVIPPGTSALTNPPGYGYALLANAPATATVNMTGFLADGTSISQSMPIGEDSGIAVYPSPYNTAANAMLFGRLSLSNSPSSPGPSGTLTWIKKEGASGSFKAGFTNTQLEVRGSPWITPEILMPPGWPLIVAGGGLTTRLTLYIGVNGTNLVPTNMPNYKFGSVNTNNGQMTITFTNNHNVIVTGHGVLLQDSQVGAGYFVSPNNNPTNFGSFIWEP